MNVADKQVVIIGAGVAGLTAADALAGWGVQVSLIEKTPSIGGHAIQLGCKATDACVKCGACVASEKLQRVADHSNVEILTSTQIETISDQAPFQISLRSQNPTAKSQTGSLHADAILMATGFALYTPIDKPYGYGQFPNVITSLEAERLLRDNYVMRRPSDNRNAQRIAFVQCVGSRDAKLGHLWCSKICCGSSLRMARLIQSRQENAQVTFFYIDIQTFGKDFTCFYDEIRENITKIRAIPGDIFQTDSDGLKVVYFDPQSRSSEEALFDIVVLSVGLLPAKDNGRLSRMLGINREKNGYISSHGNGNPPAPTGVFAAGTAMGPMSIAESVSSAEKTAFEMIQYLGAR